MSLSDAAAMPATSLPALALLAAISRSTEGECSTSCVAGCAAAAASALLRWLDLLCSDLAAREEIVAAPLREAERARSRAALAMGCMVAAWMLTASPVVGVYIGIYRDIYAYQLCDPVIATASTVLVQCVVYMISYSSASEMKNVRIGNYKPGGTEHWRAVCGEEREVRVEVYKSI